MSDCRIIITNPVLKAFLNDKTSFEDIDEFNDYVTNLLDFVYDYKGTPVRLIQIGFQDEPLVATSSKEIYRMSDVRRTNKRLGDREVLDDEDDFDKENEYISNVKLIPMSTTRQDVLYGNEFKNSPANAAQRVMLTAIQNNINDYVLFAVPQNDQIVADAENDVVLLAVKKENLQQVKSIEDVYNLSYKNASNKPVGLSFELWRRENGVPLLTTITVNGIELEAPVASFFGTAPGMRDETTHEIRVNAILRDSGVKPENYAAATPGVHRALVDSFTELDNVRQSAIAGQLIPLEINGFGLGYYPPNNLVLDDFVKTFGVTLGSLSIGEEGFIQEMTLKGVKVSKELYPTVYTKEETTWMLNNFENRDINILKSYALLLGRNAVSEKVYVKYDDLIYMESNGQERPATLDDLVNSLSKNKYRQRSRLLMNTDVMYLGTPMSSNQYIRKFFQPATGFYKDGNTYSASPANAYLAFRPGAALATVNPSKPIHEHFKPATTEIKVSSGDTEVINGTPVTFSSSLRGAYDRLSDTIYYTDSASLAEERIHSATAAYISNNPDDPRVQELTDIYGDLKRFYEEQPTYTQQRFGNAAYSLTSPEEFIARGLTDRDTMEFISFYDQSLPKRKNIIQKLIDFIKEVFGIQSETVAQLYDIYEYMRDKSQPSADLSDLLDFSQTQVVDFDDPNHQLLFVESLDFLFVQFIREQGLTPDRVQYAVNQDPKYKDLFMNKFKIWLTQQIGYNTIKAPVTTDWLMVRDLWSRYSIIFKPDKADLKEEVAEEDLVINKESDSDYNKDFFDKSGLPKSPSINEVDQEVRAILSTVPSEFYNIFNVQSFRGFKEVFYEVLDAVSPQTTLESMLKTLKDSDNKTFQFLYEQFKTNPDLQAKFYRSFNRPAVPYKILKLINKTWTYTQLTGDGTLKAENALVTNFYERAVREGFLNTDGSVSGRFLTQLKRAINENDFQTVALLIGMPNDPRVLNNPEFKNWVSAQSSDTLKKLWLEAANLKMYSPIDMKQKVANPFKALTQIYMNIYRIDKVRLALTPENNPIAAESFPNTLTELAKLYRNMPKDIPDSIDYNYLRSPMAQHSFFRDSLNTIRIHYQGGFKDTSTVKLNPTEWLILDVYTTIMDESSEFMRTETSSSSWAWGVEKKIPDNIAPVLREYLTGDVKNYLSRGTEKFNQYDKGLMLFPSIQPTQDLIDHVLGKRVNPMIEEQISMAIVELIKEYRRDVNEVFFNEKVFSSAIPPSVFEKLGTNNDINKVINKYADAKLIYRIEEAILFNGGLEYYSSFFKRAKIKISTGITPITDQSWWDTLKPEEAINETAVTFKSELKTFVVEEPIVSYKEGKLEGDKYIKGSPEFEALFQPAVDVTLKRKQLAKIPVTRLSVIKELLPKYAGYSNIETSDGSGHVNLDYYRILQKAVGNWPDSAERVFQWEKIYYNHVIKGNPFSKTKKIFGKTEEEFFSTRPDGILPPVKYVYMGPSKELGHRPISNKFSLAPLVPSMYHKTKYENIMVQMVDTRTAYFTHPTANKTVNPTKGPGSTVKLSEVNLTQTDKILTLSPRFIKEQEKTSFKNKYQNIFPSQGRKLVFSDTTEMNVWVDLQITDEERAKLFPNGEPKSRIEYFKTLEAFQNNLGLGDLHARSNFARRYNNYRYLIGRLSELNEELAENKLGLTRVYNGSLLTGYTISNPSALAATIRKYMLDDNPAVEELLTRLDAGESKVILEASPLKNEIEKIFISIVKRTISLQKVPGQPTIQVPSDGLQPIDWEKPTAKDFEKYGQTGLRYYIMKDGVVKPAQMMVSYTNDYEGFRNNSYIMSLPGDTVMDKLNFMLTLKEDTKESQKLIKAYNMPKSTINEAINFFEQNKKSFMIFAQRVPNQGLVSMDFMEIRRFLPPSAGKTLIPPLEIVAKAGSDFDIDKMFFFRPTLSKYTGQVIEESNASGRPIEDINEDIDQVNLLIEEQLGKRKNLQNQIKVTREVMAGLKGIDPTEYRAARQVLNSMYDEKRLTDIQPLIVQKENLLGELQMYTNALEESRAVVLNDMLTTIGEQILDPLNYAILTTPLGTLDIKDKIQSKAKEYFVDTLKRRNPLDDPKGFDVLRMTTEVAKRKGMLVNKDMLGIAAAGVPSHQLLVKQKLLYSISRYKQPDQKGNPTHNIFSKLLLIEPEFRADLTEQSVYNFSSAYGTDGILKSEIYNQYVTGTVDGAKEDYLGYGNHNMNTFPVVMHLVRQGVTSQRRVDFISSLPMRILEDNNFQIRDIRKRVEGVAANTFGLDLSLFREIYRDFLSSRPDNFDLIASLNTMTLTPPNILTTAGTIYKDDEILEQDKYDIDGVDITPDERRMLIMLMAIDYYQSLKYVAQQDYETQQYITVDTKPSATAFDPFKRTLPANPALARTADRVLKNTEITPLDVRQKFVYMLASVFPMSYNAYTLSQFTELENAIVDEGGRLTSRELIGLRIRMVNAWLEFILKTMPAKQGSYSTTVQGLLKDAPKSVYQLRNKRPNLKFTQDMRVFNVGSNLFTIGLVRDTKDEASNRKYYEEMLQLFNDPETKNDMQTVAIIAIMTNGFDKSFYSFNDIIPPVVLERMFDAMVSHYKNINVPATLRVFSKTYKPKAKRKPSKKVYESFSIDDALLDSLEETTTLSLAGMTHRALDPDIMTSDFTILLPLDAQVEANQEYTVTNGIKEYRVRVIRVMNQESRLANKVKMAYNTNTASKYTNLNVVVNFVEELGDFTGNTIDIPYTEVDAEESYDSSQVTENMFKDISIHANSSDGANVSVIFAFKLGNATYNSYYTDNAGRMGNVQITSQELLDTSVKRVSEASKKMWFSLKNGQQEKGFNTTTNETLISLWPQVEAAQVVFAFGEIGGKGSVWKPDLNKAQQRFLSKETVHGTPGYVVEMAIQSKKPVFVYNDSDTYRPIGWYRWVVNSDSFIPIDLNEIPTNFTELSVVSDPNVSSEASTQAYALRDHYAKSRAVERPVAPKSTVRYTDDIEQIYNTLPSSDYVVADPVLYNKTKEPVGDVISMKPMGDRHFGNIVSSEPGNLLQVNNVSDEVKIYLRWIMRDKLVDNVSSNPYVLQNPRKSLLKTLKEQESTTEAQGTFYTGDITPSPDTVFVYGANPEGRHGAGAAKVAVQKFGAKQGQTGLIGNSYGLITKSIKALPKTEITGNLTGVFDGRKRPDVTAPTPIEAIIRGEKTATTHIVREADLNYFKSLKEGDLFTVSSGDLKVLLKVKGPVKAIKSANEAWSKKEGLSVEFFNEEYKGNKNVYQLEFDFVEASGPRSIPPSQIIEQIKTLYTIAQDFPERNYKIAYRNVEQAGLNGYTGLEMIEMFNAAGKPPSNVIFSEEWAKSGKLKYVKTAKPKKPLTPQLNKIKSILENYKEESEDARRNADVFTTLYQEGKSILRSKGPQLELDAIEYALTMLKNEPRRKWIREQITLGNLVGKQIIVDKIPSNKSTADVLAYMIAKSATKTDTRIIPIQGNPTRRSVEKDPEHLYIFLDNAERTSSKSTEDIEPGSSYYQKYKKDLKLSHGGTARGLRNSTPLTVFKKEGVQWDAKDIKLFKALIDDDIVTLREKAKDFKGVKISGSITGLPDVLQTYLNEKLLELGIINGPEIELVPKETQSQLGSKLLTKSKDIVVGSRVTDEMNNVYLVLEVGDNVRVSDITGKQKTLPIKSLTTTGYYPTVSYANNDYIVVNRETIYSVSSGKQVYKTAKAVADKLFITASFQYTYMNDNPVLTMDMVDKIKTFNDVKVLLTNNPNIDTYTTYVNTAKEVYTMINKLRTKNSLDNNTIDFINSLLKDFDGLTLQNKLVNQTNQMKSIYDVLSKDNRNPSTRELMERIKQTEVQLVRLANLFGSDIQCKII